MRVLWVSHTAAVGGAELSMAEAVDALVGRGHEVHVVLPEDGPLRLRLERAAGIHFCHHYRWTNRTAPPLRKRARWTAATAHRASTAGREIARVAKATRTQVVLSNTLTIAAGALAARRARVPHIWSLHEFGREDYGLWFVFGRRASFAFMKRYTDLFLANSRAVRSYFAQWFPEAKLRVVHQSIEIPLSTPDDLDVHRAEGPYRLAFVGWRIPSKGPQDAIEAVERLTAAGLDVELDLIGGGTAEFDQELRIHATNAGVDGRIHFVEFHEGHFDRVRTADAVLMCSRSEALGRVTIEAMKLGKPVVGAAAGATPELVRHGWNGLLYEPGNSTELAQCIEHLYRDQSAAQEMARRGQAWAWMTFNRDVYAAELEEALNTVTSRS